MQYKNFLGRYSKTFPEKFSSFLDLAIKFQSKGGKCLQQQQQQQYTSLSICTENKLRINKYIIQE